MKCCTLPDGEGKSGHRKGHRKGGHKGGSVKFKKAAKACKGKHRKAFLKCMKARLKH